MQSRTLRAPAPGWAGWAVAVLLWVAADRATSQPRYRIATEGNRITRLSNGLFDARYTDQIVANLDDYLRYGVNTLVVCLQGGGLGKDELYPRVFNADGSLILQSVVWSNLRRLLLETDRRGMVLMIQYWYFRRDENVPDDEKALEITRRATSWLKDTGYENYLFDVVNEFGHPDYGNRKVFSTPEGALRFLDAVYEVNPAVLACIRRGVAVYHGDMLCRGASGGSSPGSSSGTTRSRIRSSPRTTIPRSAPSPRTRRPSPTSTTSSTPRSSTSGPPGETP